MRWVALVVAGDSASRMQAADRDDADRELAPRHGHGDTGHGLGRGAGRIDLPGAEARRPATIIRAWPMDWTSCWRGSPRWT